MYNAFIHTIEPKARLVPTSTFSASHYLESDHSFHDSRLKLDVNFIWSPNALDSMVKEFKKLKASKFTSFIKIIILFI